MNSSLVTMCKQLKLAYIEDLVDTFNDETFTQKLEMLFRKEIAERKNSRLNKAVIHAGFPQFKTFENYIFDTITFPNITSKNDLLSLNWIQKKENVLLMGAVGTGKTHMAIALGIDACRQGKTVKFYRAADLVDILQEKHNAGGIKRFRSILKKYDTLIIDEVGFVPFNQTGSELLFNVIAESYERQSVIVTTNLEFGQWTSIFGDSKLTTALVDRLVHHAIILAFNGPSLRLQDAMKRS